LAHGGSPGAIYAQVLVRNLKAARERTERPDHLDELRGGSIYYSIVGPKGRAEVGLVGTGEVIPGALPESGNRLFFTDGEIGWITGLPIQYPIWLHPEEISHARRTQEVEIHAQDDWTGKDGTVRQTPQRKPRKVKLKATAAPSEKEIARRAAASERMKARHAARRDAHA
jgi:hypothetical protein